MKKTDFMQIVSERTGLNADEIISTINSENEDIDITLKELHVFDESQLTDRLKNHVEKSKPTLFEMAIKDARNSYGLEFEGKNIDNLVKAAIEKGKKEAGIKPNEALAEKETMIEKLRQNIADIEAGKEKELSALRGELSQVKTNQMLNSLIPDNLDTALSKKDLTILLKNDIQIVEQDGKIVFHKEGEIMRDAKTQNPLDGKTVIEKWLSEKNITMKQAQQGRGDGNSRTKQTNASLESITTSAEFYAYCEANNIQRPQHPEILREVKKTNPNFFLS